MQGYYQEAGRAGRDGKRSECVLLYAAGDIPRIVRLLRGGRGRSKAKFAKGMELLNKARTVSIATYIPSPQGQALSPVMLRGVLGHA